MSEKNTSRESLKKIVLGLLVAGLLWVEPHLGNLRIQEQLEKQATPTPAEFLLQFLGEVRYTLASYLWLKVEIYHHELKLNAITSAVGQQDSEKVGEILSICRLVTRLDPHFTQAYDIGSWRLARGLGKINEATDFLQEGLRNNPQSPLLWEDMSEIYFFVLKDCGQAIPYLKKALRLNHDRIVMEDDFRMLGKCYERRNRLQEALETYRRLLNLTPADPYAQSRLRALRQNGVRNGK